jgi:hypothetical protein
MKSISQSVFAGLAAMTLLCSAQASQAASITPAGLQGEASIPFVSHGGIRDWNANGDQGIWIEGRDRQWYYATFFGPCTGLHFAIGVAFLPGATGTLDRWGSLYTRPTGRCQFTSMKRSDPPPVQQRRSRQPAQPDRPAEVTAPQNG